MMDHYDVNEACMSWSDWPRATREPAPLWTSTCVTCAEKFETCVARDSEDARYCYSCEQVIDEECAIPRERHYSHEELHWGRD